MTAEDVLKNYYNHVLKSGEIEIIAECDPYEENYSFCIHLFVAKVDDKSLWYSEDSGCSCPSPFESSKFPDDFERIDTLQRLAVLEQSVEPDAGHAQEWRDCVAEARKWLRETMPR